MNRMANALKNEDIDDPFSDSISIPVKNKEFFVISHRGFDYYTIDIGHVKFDRIKGILCKCKEIEDDLWNAQEDFYEYAKKNTALIYVAKENTVLGFLLMTLWSHDHNIILSMNEAMIRKEFQRKNLFFRLGVVAIRTFIKRVKTLKHLDTYILQGETVNPRFMSLIYKNRNRMFFLDTIFKNSRNLIEAFQALKEKNGYSLVDENHLFFLKERFPCSCKYDKKDKNFAFSEEFQQVIPEGFDPVHRGDSFVFMVSGSRKQAQFFMSQFMLGSFGPKAFMNRRIGFIKPDKEYTSVEKSGLNKFVRSNIKLTKNEVTPG